MKNAPSAAADAAMASAPAKPHRLHRGQSRLSVATVDTIEEGVAAETGLPPEVRRVDGSDEGSTSSGSESKKWRRLAVAGLLLAAIVAAVACGAIFARPTNSAQAGASAAGAAAGALEERLAEKDAEIALLEDEIAGLEMENAALAGMAVHSDPEESEAVEEEPHEEVGVPLLQEAPEEQDAQVEAEPEPEEDVAGGPEPQDSTQDVEEEDAVVDGREDELLNAPVAAQATHDGAEADDEPTVQQIADALADLEASVSSAQDDVPEDAAAEEEPLVATPLEEDVDEDVVDAPETQEANDASVPADAVEAPLVAAPLEEDEGATGSMDDGESEAIAESSLMEPDEEAPAASDVDSDAAVPPPPPADETYDAVVVGAGWSGIRAAQLLAEEGRSVLVLEANDYVGGRSKSVDSALHPGVPTDHGSEWLYLDAVGSQEEYLFDGGWIDEAPNHGAPGAGFEPGMLYVQTTGEDGASTARLMEGADALTDRLWGEFVEHKKEVLKGFGDISYADALERFPFASNEDKQHLNYLAGLLEQEFAGDIDELSLAEVEAFYLEEGCETDTVYMPAVGFGNVATSIANEVDAEFRLNAKVTDIDYEGDDVVLSYELNGIARQVTARTALVTVSLGVLKAGTIAFRPALPDAKQDAIDNMGFGLLDKAVMYWANEDDVVWPMDNEWFELVTPEDESSGVWTSFFNPSEMKGVPCLIAWIAGNEAEAMEEQSDEEIMAQIMANLRLMFPDIREPDEVTITRWGQDENFRGAYSFSVAGRTFNDDAEALREPVGNVWFAGEATNTDEWHATTVAAWDSGEAAAKEMASVLED